MLVYSSDIYLLCHKFTINYTMKFIELRVKIKKYNILRNQLDACNTSDFCLEILLVRVATIIELGNHEIFKQSILKFDILINSHIVYSNIWSPYLVKVRMSVAILSHISGNRPVCTQIRPVRGSQIRPVPWFSCKRKAETDEIGPAPR